MAYTLITSADAQSLSSDSLDQIKSSVAVAVDTHIRKAAGDGKYSVEFDFRTINVSDEFSDITDELKTELETDGYTVTVARQYTVKGNTFTVWNIDWSVA